MMLEPQNSGASLGKKLRVPLRDSASTSLYYLLILYPGAGLARTLAALGAVVRAGGAGRGAGLGGEGGAAADGAAAL